MKQTITTEEAERFERIIWALVEKYFDVTVTPLDLICRKFHIEKEKIVDAFQECIKTTN